MWCSYLTLEDFPGFGQIMGFFEPPMGHFQGAATLFTNHIECRRVTWEAKEEDSKLCVDGDAYVGMCSTC